MFSAGVLAGVVYGVSSGLGLPTVMKYVLPMIFQSEKNKAAETPAWLYSFWQNQLGGSLEKLTLVVCMFIPAMFLVRAVSGYLNTYLINKCGYVVLEKVRTMVFSKLQYLPLSYFHEQKSGDLLSRLTNDADTVRNAITQGSNDLVKQPITLISAVGFLIYQAMYKADFPFALLAGLVSLPLLVLPISLAGKKISRKTKDVQKQLGETASVITETLQSPMEVRVYQLEERQTSIFTKQLNSALRSMLKVIKYKALISPSIEFVAATVFSLAIYFAAKKGMSLESFLAIGTALYMAYEPVKKIGAINALIKQGAAAAERLDEIMQAEETVKEPPQEMIEANGKITGKIEWQNVSFAYQEKEVLKQVSLTIEPGEMVALAGPSGSGKTTLVNLLPRLFDPTNGLVKVDGTDIRHWSLKALRSQIAVVPQMPVLFQASVYENIKIGDPTASESDIIEAAKKAHAHEFILNLPDAYNTVVGERGSSLSGGQRQRIAMARAFLKNAPILILDEATSALDAESEAAVADSLTELSVGRTTLLIAHRFSTIRKASRIVVMKDGEISASGTYAELESQSGVFADLLAADSKS